MDRWPAVLAQWEPGELSRPTLMNPFTVTTYNMSNLYGNVQAEFNEWNLKDLLAIFKKKIFLSFITITQIFVHLY